jgi:hypothetical protein
MGASAGLLLGLGGAIGILVARRRLDRSSLVGLLLGPLVALPVLPALVAPTASLGEGLRRAALGAALLFLGASVSLAARRVGHRLEAAGLPVPGPFVFGAVGFVVALAERGFGEARGGRTLLAAGLLGALFAAFAAGSAVFFAQRESPSPWPWRRSAFAALLLAAALALWPRLLPWLELDADLKSLPAAPRSLLVLSLGRWPADAPEPFTPRSHLPALSALASGGIAYAHVSVEPESPGASLVTLPGDGSVARTLAERGFATAAVLADPLVRAPRGFRDVDVRPGPRGLLERHAPRSAGGGLVRALGDPLLARLGFDHVLRRPSEQTGDALRWLLDWRANRSAVPFLLYVDYAVKGESVSPESIDREIARFADRLAELDLDDRTSLLVLAEPEAGEPGEARALLRVPGAAAGERRIDAPVSAGELARLLLEIGHDAEPSALALPGLGG